MADNFTAICEPIVQKMWEPRYLTILWATMACYRDSFTFFPHAYASWGGSRRNTKLRYSGKKISATILIKFSAIYEDQLPK
jgi:hypothetical protein